MFLCVPCLSCTVAWWYYSCNIGFKIDRLRFQLLADLPLYNNSEQVVQRLPLSPADIILYKYLVPKMVNLMTHFLEHMSSSQERNSVM